MSRSGYSDDYEYVELYRQAVDAATFGARGQAFLKRLRDALDAMPIKQLAVDAVRDASGSVCALGAVDPNANSYDADGLARHFGIARALAAEIVYENDEVRHSETPEERWTRMRAWVSKQIPADDHD